MIFGKYINKYYLKNAPILILGLAALILVDYFQLFIPELYRMVINGMNGDPVLVNGQAAVFDMEFLLDQVCRPMIITIIVMVVGRFLWRVCFFGSAIRVVTDLRTCMFAHSKELSQEYYQVNKVGNLMSLYTNDLDTVQECFGDGILMFCDALFLGLLAVIKMWRMKPLPDRPFHDPDGISDGRRHNARQIPDEKVGRAPGGLFRAVRFRAGKLFRSCCHQSIRQRDERADDVP